MKDRKTEKKVETGKLKKERMKQGKKKERINSGRQKKEKK
jgi:hypothetical protein